MGIANYTNLSELMNGMLKDGRAVSISDMVREADGKMLILASEGERADKSDLENGFIALVETLYRSGDIKAAPANAADACLLKLFESGKLAADGYGGSEADQFLDLKWIAVTAELPVIININL